jgi:hypothetical protein
MSCEKFMINLSQHHLGPLRLGGLCPFLNGVSASEKDSQDAAAKTSEDDADRLQDAEGVLVETEIFQRCRKPRWSRGHQGSDLQPEQHQQPSESPGTPRVAKRPKELTSKQETQEGVEEGEVKADEIYHDDDVNIMLYSGE